MITVRVERVPAGGPVAKRRRTLKPRVEPFRRNPWVCGIRVCLLKASRNEPQLFDPFDIFGWSSSPGSIRFAHFTAGFNVRRQWDGIYQTVKTKDPNLFLSIASFRKRNVVDRVVLPVLIIEVPPFVRIYRETFIFH